jgi:hypothetical protein
VPSEAKGLLFRLPKASYTVDVLVLVLVLLEELGFVDASAGKSASADSVI